jgi:hypothetical protein
MRGVIAACLLILVLTAVPADAQEIGDTLFFPVVARLAGQPPSQWVTDVAVCNLNDYSIVVGFEFFEEGESYGLVDLDFPVRRTLGPFETRSFEDVLSTLFGITKNIKGSLLVSCTAAFGLPNPDGTDIVANSRTYDISSPLGGTAGQTVPANGELANLTGWPSVATGARNDADFRSNFGLINSSLVQVKIHYTIFQSNGMIIAEGSKTLGPLSMQQWSFNALGVGTVAGPLTVMAYLDQDNVSPDPCADFANSFFAYFSKGDQVSQDAEFVYLAPGGYPECIDD